MDLDLNTPTSPLLAAALGYAAQGWQIIPLHSFVDGCCTCEQATCGSPAKHPLNANGVHGATTDEETIRRWWKETGGLANVGIATGASSGLVVVDVDAKSGGLETLARLEQDHGKLPTTPTASTGGGGRHYFYRYPTGHVIGNRAGIQPGIDIRGEGGYVVASPSAHASGRAYAWAVPPDEPLAEAPPWLLGLMTGKPVATASTSLQQPPPVKANTLVVQTATDDLATHPGAAEGQRNDTLCRLVGAHLSRGKVAEDILALAVVWAERCAPPMREAEVERTVQSLASKHDRTTLFVRSQGDGEFESLPLPAPPPWPVLNEAAYYGLAGEIVQTVEPQSEADPAALLLSSLVCFGNLIGRQPHYRVEGDRHCGNLFATLVGTSGTGRKGTSLGRTLSLFDGIDGDWSSKCQSTGLSSGEGLIWALRDSIECMEPVKEKGKITGYQQVVRDAGVEDKRLLVVEPEFAQTLRVLGREGNTLSPVIRAAWDKGDLKTLTKNSLAHATDAHVSIIGHITLPELRKYLNDTELWNGFANRFLWILVKRSKLLPDGGQQLDLNPLKHKLTEAYKGASRIERMERSPAAQVLWRSLYPTLTAGTSGLAGAATGRGEAQTLRLSLIFALLDRAHIIDLPHLQAAHAVWCYCKASARSIFHEEEEDPLERLLLDIIKAQPGVNHKGLYKATGGHIPAATLMQALVAIRDQGLARCETKATGGRPAERWYPCDQTSKGCGEVSVAGEGELSSFARREPVAKGSAGAQSFAPQPTVPEVRNSQLKAEQEPDKPATAIQLVGPADALPDAAAVPAKPLSLADFFNAMNQVGGRLVRQGDVVTIDAGGKPLPPEVEVALAAHQAALAQLMPIMPPAAVASVEPPIVAEAVAEAEAEAVPWRTDKEFFALLKSPEGRARLAEWHAKRAAVSKHADAAAQAEPLR